MIRIKPDIMRATARICIQRPHLSSRKTARAADCSPGSALKIRDRVRASGLTLELLEELDDVALLTKLFGEPAELATQKPHPDWIEIEKLMAQPDATLMVIWEDWIQAVPDGIGYQQFTKLYGQWLAKRKLTLRKTHRAGVNTFIDYAGATIPIYLPDGTTRDAAVFIGVLGASNYTFAHLCWGQSIADFIDANNRMVQFFGGVTQFTVPDNLKAAVIVAGLKRLKLNQNYREWAAHNNTVVLPARVEKPKDKAPAEVGVQVAQRHIIFRMRQRRWHSLEEAQAALAALLEKLNDRPFAKMPGTRRERFETIDKPALRPLPKTVFEPCELLIRKKAGDEYHVEYGGNSYSVPYGLAHTFVDLRVTRSTVEILQHHRRIHSHQRSYETGQRITAREHLPDAHRHYLDGEPVALLDWSAEVGPSTKAVIGAWLTRGSNFHTGLVAARGLRGESDVYGSKRIESACKLALEIRSTTLGGIRTILITESDLRPRALPAPSAAIQHENIRGPGYYAANEESSL